MMEHMRQPAGFMEFSASTETSDINEPNFFLNDVLSRLIKKPFAVKITLNLILIGGITVWVFHYLTAVSPALEDHNQTQTEEASCSPAVAYVQLNFMVSLVVLACLACSRMLVYFPFAETLAQNANLTSLHRCNFHFGRIARCMVKGFLTELMVLFAFLSVLSAIGLCIYNVCFDHHLALKIKRHSMLCILISFWCVAITRWQRFLELNSAVSRVNVIITSPAPSETPEAQMPSEIVGVLETILYDAEMFGEEDDKHYPIQCPICLLDWTANSVITLTKCGHAFHKECLKLWLGKVLKCPLCRQRVDDENASNTELGTARELHANEQVHNYFSHVEELGEEARGDLIYDSIALDYGVVSI